MAIQARPRAHHLPLSSEAQGHGPRKRRSHARDFDARRLAKIVADAMERIDNMTVNVSIAAPDPLKGGTYNGIRCANASRYSFAYSECARASPMYGGGAAQPAYNREGHRNGRSEWRTKKELPSAPKKLPKSSMKSFQYFSRTTRENSALRANGLKFIGKRRSDFVNGCT
jgi:hypothetical protein